MNHNCLGHKFLEDEATLHRLKAFLTDLTKTPENNNQNTENKED